jgi:ParE toxin of type II toxin-antitoxin system, parDE
LKKFSIVLSPAAIADIQKGIDYYKQIDKALGIRFHNSVKSTFNELKKSPHYQIRYKNVRIRTVKNFPYLVHFIIKGNEVIVYGVRFDKMEKNEVI